METDDTTSGHAAVGSEEPPDVFDVADDDSVVPSVVAVVVTHDPGDWFDETLASLAAQDYPALSVLVVDSGSSADPTPRIAERLPDAYVRRLDHNPGFGVAANEVLAVVEGASFFLLCHDDVALAPDAARLLVEEAYRSNAGVVGPKLVGWDDPTRIQQVGMFVDKVAYPLAPVEPGELDQEQHDAVRDVFYVPGGVALVRADLFAALGGYDPEVSMVGEDVELCWRAQVAGARVIVAPAAVVRHVEALERRGGFDLDHRLRLARRHRLRAVLACYSAWHRLRVLPQAVVLSLVEIAHALTVGRRRSAGDIVAAYRWNWSRRRQLAAARARLAEVRTVPDHDVRRLQVGGSARVTAYVRERIVGRDEAPAPLRRTAGDVAGALRTGPNRASVVLWGGLALVLVVGSRQFLFGPAPAVVDLPPLPSSPWPVLAAWLSSWRDAGLGSEGPAPIAYGLLGVGGTVLLGAMGVLRALLVAIPLAAGPVGVARVARVAGSRRASWAAAVAYAAIPVPYNALAEGRWGGLVLWGATPWVAGRLASASRDTPFDRLRPRPWVAVLGMGLLVAVAAAAVPIAVVLPLLLAVALVLGGAVVGRGRGVGRMLGVAAGGALVGVALHLPWALDFAVPDATWAPFGGVTPSGPGPSLGEVLRFESGPLGAAPLGWLFLGAAALPLLIGQSWRATWAVRWWVVALAGFALAVAGGVDGLPVALGPIELGLAPAACGLALATGLGVTAFEVDLPGYRFGWRQALSLASAGALAAGCAPVIAGALDGRWDAPGDGMQTVLSFLDDEQVDGGFRTLWLGDPTVLPLAGWELRDGLAWATTDDGYADALDRWPGSPDGTARLVSDALELAVSGETSRLGRLLGPMAIRYVVVVGADAPLASADDLVPAPPDVVDALAAQLDLSEVEIDGGLHVYRNTSWFAARALLPGADASAAPDGYFEAARRIDLGATASPVLLDADGRTRFEGELPASSDVWLSAASSSRWSLSAGGESARRGVGFGWGTHFTVGNGGSATLEHSTPIYHRLLVGVQGAAWVLVALTLLGERRRRRAFDVVRRRATVGAVP